MGDGYLSNIAKYQGLRYFDSSYSDRDSPPLLLLHGLGNCLEFWLPVIGALGTARRIIAPDLPGFGHSATPPKFDLDSFRTALSTLLHHLRVDRVDIVGHSMGGLVALDLASGSSEQAHSVTLVDGHLFTTMNVIKDPFSGARHMDVLSNLVLQFVGATVPLTERSALRAFSSSLVRRSLLWPFARHPEDLDPKVLARALGNGGGSGAIHALMLANEFHLPEMARSVMCPTHLIWGLNDRLLSNKDLALAREFLPIRSETPLGDCGHWALLEAPEAVAAAIKKQVFSV